MAQKEGYIDAEKTKYVCKLSKDIYGLNNQFAVGTLLLISIQIEWLSFERYWWLSSRKMDVSVFIILAVYVDDFIPLLNEILKLNVEKESLCPGAEMVDKW